MNVFEKFFLVNQIKSLGKFVPAFDRLQMKNLPAKREGQSISCK